MLCLHTWHTSLISILTIKIKLIQRPINIIIYMIVSKISLYQFFILICFCLYWTLCISAQISLSIFAMYFFLSGIFIMLPLGSWFMTTDYSLHGSLLFPVVSLLLIPLWLLVGTEEALSEISVFEGNSIITGISEYFLLIALFIDKGSFFTIELCYF